MTAALGAALALAALSGCGVLWAELRRRRELVVRAGHELRGPLTAASLALHGAGRRGELPPRLLAALELELRRAVVALDDLRAAADGRPPDAGAAGEPVALHDLLACHLATWREVARAHGTDVVLHPGPAGALVRADAVRLAQALSNVVANAIEHGGGVVEVRARRRGEGLRVEVLDGGPGLPAPVADLVGRARGGRGTRGRGLAIASALVEAQGGRLGSAPAPEGACIAIDLPAASTTAA